MNQNKLSTSLFYSLVGWLAFFTFITAYGQTEPAGLLLTWQQDPTTTMTIDWHTVPDDESKPALYYKALNETEWRTVSASPHPFPYSDRTIHRTELTGLEPASNYQFRVGEFERVYSFRTMPEKNYSPIRFAAGGDTSNGEMFRQMNRTAMKYDPDFIVWGGDLAYANGREENLDRWISWFDRVREDLVTEDGRVVPVVLAIGNHDVLDHHYPGSETTIGNNLSMHEFIAKVKKNEMEEATDETRAKKGPFFYALFAFPGQPGYGVLDFGNYLSLISLDSSHSNLISGQQTSWLKEVLKSRAGRPHVIPVYHKPAYPSGRVQPGGIRNQFWSEQVLQHWVPLFEEYGVRVALENDDHTYKRTYPLRRDMVDPSGIVYIGDGSWGVGKREPKTPEEVWYLKKSASENSAIIVTLHGPHQHFLIVNEEGTVIDEYPERAYEIW